MNTVSILNFKKMPEIRSRVYSSEILPLKGSNVFKSDTHTHFYVMLSGSATYKSLSEESDSKEKPFHSNYILILPAGQNIVINVNTLSCQLLHISFDLYASPNMEDILAEGIEDGLKYSKLALLKNYSSIASFEENFPYFQADVHNLILHCKMNKVDLKVVSFPLDAVLYSMLKVQFSTTVNVLRSVKAAAIIPHKTPFDVPLNFAISEIEFLSHQKTKKSNYENICKITNKHVFIERPSDKEHYSFEITNDPLCNSPQVYNFSLTGDNHFKIWLFPEEELPSLEESKNTGIISFKFKSNQTGNFLLMLYHTPSYQSINYYFEITEPDVWTEFEIPISKNSSLNAMLPYIEKAVQYIQDNYSEKITIQDIADHVTIHPSYLSSLFRKSLNQSVNSYINFHRINVAKQLLKNGNTSITDIALQTGFYDAQHFLKTFKKNTGFTPSEYRNM